MSNSAEPGLGVWPDETPRLASRLAAGAMAGVLVLLGAFNVVCLGAGAAVLVILGELASGATSLVEVARPENMGAGVFAASFFAGFGGFMLTGWLATSLLGWKTTYTLGLRGPTVVGLVAGGFGGLVVGVFPGWIAEQLRDAFPELASQSTLAAIQRILASNDVFEVTLLVITVAVLAPIFEEFCFRGLLWNALERVFPGTAGQAFAFIGTSLVFALAHLDPIQAPAIAFTAFFLGWLRWMTGSVWPCILAHFMNNALATVFGLMLARGALPDESATWPLALAGVGLTLLCSAVLLVFRRRPPATPEAAWEAREA